MTAEIRPVLGHLAWQAKTAAVVYGGGAGAAAIAALIVGLATYEPPKSTPAAPLIPTIEPEVPISPDAVPVKGGAAPLVAGASPVRGAGEGATTGAVGGAIVGGSVGGVTGAGDGAIARGIADEQRPKFRNYVVERRVPSYIYKHEVGVGVQLPSSGVTYYEVPAQYGVREYRYTVVNDRPVLVDPRSHTIVQVIE